MVLKSQKGKVFALLDYCLKQHTACNLFSLLINVKDRLIKSEGTLRNIYICLSKPDLLLFTLPKQMRRFKKTQCQFCLLLAKPKFALAKVTAEIQPCGHWLSHLPFSELPDNIDIKQNVHCFILQRICFHMPRLMFHSYDQEHEIPLEV